MTRPCSKPALTLINFFATDEGLSLTTYGLEGQHWDYDADGNPVVRPECYNDIAFSWVYQMCGREELSYCRVKFGEYAWEYVVQSDAQPRLSDVTALIDDPEWYNGTDAETYINEECAKFLTGEREPQRNRMAGLPGYAQHHVPLFGICGRSQRRMAGHGGLSKQSE